MSPTREARVAGSLCSCGIVPVCEHTHSVDAIWISAAQHMGLRVTFSNDVYAAYDGRGTLVLGARDTLDADDSFAQLIFHELCHSLVEGHDAFRCEDWGLDNVSSRHVEREHACLRLQVALADPFGLRRVFAPTTEFRVFYDALPSDPFTPQHDASVIAAKIAAVRAERAPWAPHIERALEATASVIANIRGRSGAEPTSVYGAYEPPRARHPSGFFLPREDAVAAEARCSICAWCTPRRSGAQRCLQKEATVDPAWPACERFEPALDCSDCGACCREAYDAVSVGKNDTVAVVHPELVVRIGRRREMRRDGNRCAALASNDDGGPTYLCRVYEQRPRSCREFERSGPHCLTARRRVGLSR